MVIPVPVRHGAHLRYWPIRVRVDSGIRWTATLAHLVGMPKYHLE